MIRISSMRLKRQRECRISEKSVAINDKNLKYEIETTEDYPLQQASGCTINDKNLKYEIETYL